MKYSFMFKNNSSVSFDSDLDIHMEKLIEKNKPLTITNADGLQIWINLEEVIFIQKDNLEDTCYGRAANEL